MIDRDEDGWFPAQRACPECGSTSYTVLGECHILTERGACCDPCCSDCGLDLGGHVICAYHTEQLGAALMGPEPEPEIAEQDEAQEWALLAKAGCTLDEARAYLAHYEGRTIN